MKRFEMRDLEEFGIVPLTGEADALSFRILCDLTAKGAEIVREALGLPHDCKFSDNWNTGGSGPKHVGSIMLSADMAAPFVIIGILKSDKYCQALKMEDGSIIGVEHGYKWLHGTGHWDDATDQFVIDTEPMLQNEDGTTQPWPSCYGKVQRCFDAPAGNHPRVGFRNTHAMSGRTS